MTLGSFTIPIPLTASDIAELADFIELNAICSPDHTISALDVASQTSKALDEEQDRVGSGEVPDNVNAAFAEIGRRQGRGAAVGQYPFSLDGTGDTVRYSANDDAWLYLFCLLATRCNMNNHRSLRGFDATKLFEEITVHVLKHHAKTDVAFVVGTSRNLASGGGLQAAVQGFLSKYAEAGAYVNQYKHGASGDGGCDVIGWHSHVDSRLGKSTIFCSCKTGTSWKDSSDYIPRPAQWSRAYVNSRAFAVDPIPCIVVAEALSDLVYGQKVEEPKLLAFDRTRVAAASASVPSILRRQCVLWTKLAARRGMGMPFGAV